MNGMVFLYSDGFSVMNLVAQCSQDRPLAAAAREYEGKVS